MAATALAVSCEVTAITGISETPHSLAISGSSVPRAAPGIWMGRKRRRGRPKRSMRSKSQSRRKGSSSCEVEAMVYSAPILPVSR